ncbi:Sak single strand annealing protein [Lonepinella koalarum]
MSFQQEVWECLSKINVNDKVEKKRIGNNTLTYLSWAWAWGVLMEYYPESTYEIHPDRILPDGSVIVGVTVTIKQREQSFSRYMWLPVMNFKNESVINPNATQLNKTYMRCLTKAIGMCGLGHYIYAGEDLPNEDDGKEPPKQQAMGSPQKPTGIKERIANRIAQTQNQQELEKAYAEISPWLEANHPEFIDELNSQYDSRMVDLTR